MLLSSFIRLVIMSKQTRLSKNWVIQKLPRRPKHANKGTFGKVLICTGSENYPGAAYLSSAACYRVGAGLVTLVTEPQVKIIVSRKLPEVTFLSRNEALKKIDGYDVLLIGSGLGQSGQAAKLIEKILIKDLPVTVIDGDGLNILSQKEKWWEKIKGEVILTPHPGEMSRLTGLSVEEIQKDRQNIAQKYAGKWKQTVVLKGANTVIASCYGKAAISPFANPVLATAGTGDVLAGIISGMLAQGLKPFEAACVGVYLHGLAGGMLKDKIGTAGALASELLPLLPQSIKKLV